MRRRDVRNELGSQLIKMDTYPLAFHPGDVAWSLNAVAFYQQREGIWNSDRICDLKTCATNRDVAHEATDCALVECDHARLQGAQAHVFALFRHSDRFRYQRDIKVPQSIEHIAKSLLKSECVFCLTA